MRVRIPGVPRPADPTTAAQRPAGRLCPRGRSRQQQPERRAMVQPLRRRSETARRSKGELRRNRGLAGTRVTEQEKYPWRTAEELLKAFKNPAPAGEVRCALLDIGPVKFREMHNPGLRSAGRFRSGLRRSPNRRCPRRRHVPGPLRRRLTPEAWPGRRGHQSPHRPPAGPPRSRQIQPRSGAARQRR